MSGFTDLLPKIQGNPIEGLGNAALGFGKNLLSSTWNPMADAINNTIDENRQAQNQNNIQNDASLGNAIKTSAQETGNVVKNTVTNPKLLADIASFGIPFGKGASLLTKAVAPGMAVGGLNAAAQKNATPGSVTGNTIAGGVMGPLTMGAGKVISNILPKIGEKMQGAAANNIKQNFAGVDAKSLNMHNLGDTVNAMMRYGAKTPEDFVNLSKQVTGQDGFLSTLTNRAVNKSPAMDTTGLTEFTQNLLDNVNGITQRDEKKINNQVSKAMMAMAVPPSEIEGGESNAAMSQIRQFENQANNHSTEAARSVAPVYNTIAKEMKDRLLGGKMADGTINPLGGADNVLLNDVLTPDVINQAKQIHPQLGADLQDLVNQGGTVANLRHLAAPFVNAASLGKDAINAVKNSIPQGGISTGTLAAGLGAINPAAAAAILAKKVLYDSGAAQRARTDIMSNLGNKLSRAALPKIGDYPAGQIGARLPSILAPVKGINNNSTNNGKQYNPDNPHGGTIPLATSPVNTSYKTINDLPTDMNNLKPDSKSGNYGVANVWGLKDNNGALIAIKSGDASALRTQVDDLKRKGGSIDGITSHPASYYTNSEIGKQQIQSAYDTIKNKEDLGNSINPTKYEQLESKAEDARAILKTAPLNILNTYSDYNKLASAFNGKYRRLADDLQALEGYSGKGTLFAPQTNDVALQTLDQVNKQFLGDLYTSIRNTLPSNTTGSNLNNFINPNVPAEGKPMASPTSSTNSLDIVGGTLPTIGNNNAGLPLSQ